MATREIRGAHLEVSEQGAGPTLLLVHGSASDRRTWVHQRDAFATSFRVISYSRRYHWPNEPIPKGLRYVMGEHVDDLEALIDSLDVSSVHLVGHSYGGFLSLLLAIRRPRLARSLVLAEPPAITLFVSSTPRPSEILRLSLTRPRVAAAIVRFGMRGVRPAAKAFRRGDTEAGIRIFGDAVFGSGGYDRLPDDRKARIWDNRTNIEAEVLGPGFPPLDPSLVRRVRIPALLTSGEQSVPLFRHVTNRLDELLPNARRAEIPEAAHMMHEDNPTAFNAAVLSFLQKLD